MCKTDYQQKQRIKLFFLSNIKTLVCKAFIYVSKVEKIKLKVNAAQRNLLWIYVKKKSNSDISRCVKFIEDIHLHKNSYNKYSTWFGDIFSSTISERYNSGSFPTT